MERSAKRRLMIPVLDCSGGVEDKCGVPKRAGIVPAQYINEWSKAMNFHDYYRGEIYFANLNPYFGHEQGGTRPVLILQNDVGNFYSPTVIVAAATSATHKKANLPTHVTLENVEGLPGTSIFMLEVLRTIDKRRISGSVGKLTPEQMDEIDEALRISLRLDDSAFLPTEVDAP